MNGFEHDIRAQSGVLRKISAAYWSAMSGELAMLRAFARENRPVLLTGMGGSLAAAEFAVPIFRAAGRSAVAIDASEITDGIPSAFPPDTMVVAVSQGGQSSETLDAVTSLKRARLNNIVAVTNDLASPLARLAPLALPMLAGAEKWAAAKSFTASQFILGFIAHALAPGDAEPNRARDEAEMLIRTLDDLVRNSLAEDAAHRLGSAPYLAVLARGSSMSSAKYAALLFKESAAMPCEAITTSDFGHGPVELTTLPIGVILLASDPVRHSSDVALADRLAAQGVPIWLLSDAPAGAINRNGAVVTQMSTLRPRFAAIAFAIELQLFAAALARIRGREPGVFTTFNRADMARPA